MTTELAIRCDGLVKRYPPDIEAVNGLDLHIRRGECFGLLGPNGAGKTTTIEILEGLLRPTAGHVEVLGRRWEQQAQELRSRLGITLQQTRLPDRLTVGEIVRLFRSFYSRGREPGEVLHLVALEDKRNAWYEKLSGGQQQRLAVACALVSDPELLFLDEPTTGLDPQSRRQLWEVIINMRAAGCTVLLTTHYMDEAQRLCDRVAIIDHGRVIATGTPRELIDRMTGQQVVEFATADNGIGDLNLLTLAGVTDVRRLERGWALTVNEVHVAIPALLTALTENELTLEHLSTHSATLEDVFVSLTGRNLRE